MFKRPRGRPRKGDTSYSHSRKTAADILSENNLPVKNLSNGIVRSSEYSYGGQVNTVEQDLKNRKRGIIIQSGSKKQCDLTATNKSEETTVPMKLEEYVTTAQNSRSSAAGSLHQEDERVATNDLLKKNRRGELYLIIFLEVYNYVI